MGYSYVSGVFESGYSNLYSPVSVVLIDHTIKQYRRYRNILNRVPSLRFFIRLVLSLMKC